MKRRPRGVVKGSFGYGDDVSGLQISKRRKHEQCAKKARGKACHGRSKGMLQKEMERICQTLNIGEKPSMEKLRVVNKKEVEDMREASQEEMKKVRKMSFLRDNEEEERNIKQLEKKLFLSRRKNTNMPRSFIDEGLDYILEVVDNKYKDKAFNREASETGQKRSLEKGIESGRSKIAKTLDAPTEDDDSNDQVDFPGAVASHSKDTDKCWAAESKDLPGSGNGSEKKEGIWEDIYGRKHDKAGNVIAEKYVPPARRSAELSAEKKRELLMLKKQLKGSLNRLSQSTVQPIGSQVEQLYQKCSNHDVNSTLFDVICEAIIAPFLTPQRMVMDHAMLVAYLHCNVNAEVGAYILENMTTKLNTLYKCDEQDSKEVDNCVLFISYLFIFKVTHSRLIFDIINMLSTSFRDRDVEMVLLILRSVGFGLRKHDPATLKETMLSLQKKSVQDSEQDPRKRFMLDVLMAIRNNNIQKIPNCDPSMVEHASKTLHSLCRKGSTIHELNISLQDLLQAKERGKWWLVGSAWVNSPSDCKDKPANVAFSNKIVQLAKKHHMNTDVRRNIFCIIMTAEDYLDASEKIVRLNLSSTQQQQVCYVLLHCCMKEKGYNQYYSALAKLFCKRNRRFYMSLQCAIWDKMKELEHISQTESSNLALFFKTLLCQDVLSLAALKNVQFVDMSPSLLRFLRQLFINMLTSETNDVIRRVFSRISPKLHLLREGLRLFLRQLQETGDPNVGVSLHNSLQEAYAALVSVERRDNPP
ncbi:nucleolar MIF4G domain-containing protein 1 homolog [Ornithodoros turicata]|uniref:nucleolar MIF4G domain-containing protein 1 homolog n=1 Tax=Ornithodoros turicata TaxID=34597 RepID=UPI00313A1D42